MAAGKQIEFGIRIDVDALRAGADVQQVSDGFKNLATQATQAGQAMAQEFSSGTTAVTATTTAVASMAETEQMATDRIRAMVAASQQQSATLNAAAQAADQASASTRQAATETAKYADAQERASALARSTAQMSSPQTAAAQATVVSTQESEKYVAALQRQFNTLGLNNAELAQYEVKVLGGNSALQKKASALAANSEALRVQISEEERAGKAADSFIASLQKQVDTLGMSRTQLLSHQAAQLGVSDAAAPMIAKLAETGAGAHSAGGHMEGFSFKTASAKRELLVLAHELSQGQYSRFGGSMMVLGEQTGAAGLLFSAAGLSAIALAAAVVGVGYAMIKGASEQKHMNDALISTNYYAGVTSDGLNALAHQAVATGGSIGEAKKAVTELAALGKFSAEQIGYITEAAVALEHATGTSVKKTIKEFESLAVQSTGSTNRATEVITRATIKLDDTYHFLTESVYEQIRALEKEGRAKDASALATKVFAQATLDGAHQSEQNLGSIATGWKRISDGIGRAIDKMNEWGKKVTPAMTVNRLNEEIAQIDNGTYSAIHGGDRNAYNQTTLATIRVGLLKELTVAQAALNVVDKKAADGRAAGVTQSEGIHAAFMVQGEDIKLQRRGWSELAVSLAEYAANIEKIKKANPDSPLVTPEAVTAGIAARTKAHSEKASGSGQDDRSKILQDALVVEKTAFDREKAIYDAREKMLTFYHSKFGTSDADFYAGRAAARAEYIAAEATSFEREAAIIQSFQAKNPKEIATSKEKYDALLKQHLQFVDKMKAASGDDSVAEMGDGQARYDDTIKAIQSVGVAEGKRLDDDIAKQREKNAEIGKSKEQIDLARQAVVNLRAEQLASDADFIRGVLDREELDDKARAAYQMRLNFLDDEVKKLREKSGLLAAGAALEAADKATKDNDKYMSKLANDAIKDWERAGNSIANSMSTAFGSGGKAVGQMFKAYSEGMAGQLRAQKQLAEAKKLSDTNPEKIREIDQAHLAGATAQIKSYADMAGAAQGFFDEGSKGYQAMAAAAQVMHAAEVALTLVKGVNAVLTQGEGDPYTAFGRMAAMVAVVAALGVTIGGVGAGDTTAKDRQKAQGTGTVLGNSNAKSDSIAKSMELAASNSSIELSYTAGMLASLRNIESSIGGLGNLLSRSSSLDTQFSSIQTGTKVTGGALTTATAGIAGGVGGAAAGAYYGMAAGSVGGAIGMAVGAVVGTVVGFIASKLTNVKTKIVDQGIAINQQSLGSTVTNGVQGNTYADVNVKKSFLGMSYSNKTTQVTGKLEGEIAQQFTGVIANLRTGIISAVDTLGLGGKSFIEGLDAINVAIPNLSLKGLSGEEIQKTLEATFSNLGDNLAKSALPGLDQFQQVGEGYFETLTRVAANYANLDAILAASSTTFGTTGMASLAARERLISMAGGIDELASKSNSFAENYLSQAERLAPVQKHVTEQMAALGYASVTTREQFKNTVLDLANSGALANEAGAKRYLALLDLESAFAKTHAATEDLTKSEQAIADERKDLQSKHDQLTMTSVELLAKERASVDAKNLALYDSVAAENAKAAALTEANDILTLQSQMYAANGDKAGAAAVLQKQHAAALVGLTPALAAATQATWDAQAAETVRADALAAANSLLEIQGQIYALTGDKASAAAVLQQQHAAALALLSPELRHATQMLWAMKPAVDAANEAMAAVKRAAEVEKTAAKASLDARVAILKAQKSSAEEQASLAVDASTAAVKAKSDENARLKSLAQSLRSTLDGMRMNESLGFDRALGQMQIAQALATAKVSGVLPAADAMEQALKAVSQPSESLFSSFEDYARDFYVTAGQIADLNDLTGHALSKSDTEIGLAQTQLELMQENKVTSGLEFDRQMKLAQDAYDAQIMQIDQSQEDAQALLDATLNQTRAVMSVEEALRQLRSEIVLLAKEISNTSSPSSTPVLNNSPAAASIPIAAFQARSVQLDVGSTGSTDSNGNVERKLEEIRILLEKIDSSSAAGAGVLKNAANGGRPLGIVMEPA